MVQVNASYFFEKGPMNSIIGPFLYTVRNPLAFR